MFVQVDVRSHFLFDPSAYDLLARHLAQGKGFTTLLVEARLV